MQAGDRLNKDNFTDLPTEWEGDDSFNDGVGFGARLIHVYKSDSYELSLRGTALVTHTAQNLPEELASFTNFSACANLKWIVLISHNT